MEMVRLGSLEVSRICLGSMTWGAQNSVDEGCAQIDQALEAGVNFIDTAEMYPTTPLSAETQGDTERVIGAWLRRGGARDRIVVATKVTGFGIAWIRDGAPIQPDGVRQAVEASLRRLGVDEIDLYQLHWPNRGHFHMRRAWSFDPTTQPSRARIRDDVGAVLETLGALVREGKIREIGLSNESAWGTQQFFQLAQQLGAPRPVSIQNEYSLLCRHFDLDMAELAHHERIGLLAFSPLAAGILSGKYQNGAVPPEGSRRRLNDALNGRWNPHSEAAVDLYAEIAARHGLALNQMALAFCLTRPFMSSVIIGATSPAQLASNLAAAELRLSDACLEDIAAAHRRWPMPM